MADENFWEGFQASLEEEPDVNYNTVSTDVLSAFGISYINEKGGYLKNVDIKRADALSVLKASLLEEYANEGSSLIEMCINEDGEAYFYEVGNSNSNIRPYYSIPASSYVKPNASVLVTGGKPKQERITLSTGWYPLIGPNGTYTIHDTTKLNSSCYAVDFSTHATITYEDPVRHKPSPNWNDGVEDIFELETPFDRFLGYTWRITPPSDLVTNTTKIYKQSQSTIPVLVSHSEDDVIYKIGMLGNYPNLGIPRKRAMRTELGDNIQDCTVFEDTDFYCSDTTVPINIAMKEGLTYDTLRGDMQVSKVLGVQGVFVIGTPLKNCYGIAKEGMLKSDNIEENTNLFIAAYSTHTAVFKLNESIDYALLYDRNLGSSDSSDPGIPCIQFANNLQYYDNAKIGTGVQFYINTEDYYLSSLFNGYIGYGSILASEHRGGILVESVWAQLILDTPCFVIVDPRGNANKIAAELVVEVLPLILRDLPSPIAYNGTLVDQSDGISDNNPTTLQSFKDTALENVYNSMGSSRTLSLNFASLDEDATVRLSQKLHDLLLDDTGNIYTHTCPPTDSPQLGDKCINGGIVNSIEYAYTDQGSYLITVIEGPEFFGDFAGIDGDIYYKRTEEVSVQGTIIQDLGNHVDYVVHVDGIGPLKCINACATVLAKRDRVSVTIHNNAVES